MLNNREEAIADYEQALAYNTTLDEIAAIEEDLSRTLSAPILQGDQFLYENLELVCALLPLDWAEDKSSQHTNLVGGRYAGYGIFSLPRDTADQTRPRFVRAQSALGRVYTHSGNFEETTGWWRNRFLALIETIY